MIQIDIISALSLAGIWFAVTLAALIYYKSNKNRKYDEENNRARIDMLRESYEKKMYDIAERLVRTEERWKDMNHLVISAQQREISPYVPHKTTLTEFLKAHGITEDDTKIHNESVFVLTPFHSRYEKTFQVIAETCREVGLTAYRGDETHIRGDLLPHTLKLLCRARLVIANVDGRNPNVFYELGIAHAIDKGTILVASNLDNVPIDVKSNRLLIHKDSNDLKNQLKTALTKALVQTKA